MIGVAALSLMMLSALEAEPAGYFVPEASDFRRQKIHKAAAERDWPFVANGGTLLCTMIMGKPTVYFLPEPPYEGKRALILDVNVFAMTMSNVGIKDVLLPYKTPEELIQRIAPFVAMGQMLCKQKNDRVVPGSEL